MDDSIELMDGSFITPRNVFDAMDTVEEYLGTDFRQFLESYFLDGTETDPADPDDHYKEVLGNLDFISCQMETQLAKKPMRKEELMNSLNRLQATIRHEIGGQQ